MGSDQGGQRSATSKTGWQVRPYHHGHGSQRVHVWWPCRRCITCWADGRNVASYNELDCRGVASVPKEGTGTRQSLVRTRSSHLYSQLQYPPLLSPSLFSVCDTGYINRVAQQKFERDVTKAEGTLALVGRYLLFESHISISHGYTGECKPIWGKQTYLAVCSVAAHGDIHWGKQARLLAYRPSYSLIPSNARQRNGSR